MTEEDANSEVENLDDISDGKIADNPDSVNQVFTEDIRNKFEIFSYRNAAPILANSFPHQFENIITGLRAFEISREMIRMPGGNKGPIAMYTDTLFTEDHGWKETRITADLHVKLLHAKRQNDLGADPDNYLR